VEKEIEELEYEAEKVAEEARELAARCRFERVFFHGLIRMI